MQEFDDYKLPDENSLSNLRQGYASLKPVYRSKVSSLQNEEQFQNSNLTSTNPQTMALFNNVNWQQNRDLLRILCNRANNRGARSYIRGLIPLSEQDFVDLNNFYSNSTTPRTNPTILEEIPNSFNNALREYIRSEVNLIDNLLQIQFLDDEEERQTTVFNIIRRRLDALDTLTSFFAGGIFA